MEFHAYNILNQSGLHPAFFVVYKRKADADILVHRNLAARPRIIQPAAETCQKHHRKLETLGFVNRHDADCIITFRRHLDLTHGNLVLLYGIDVLHEAVKGAALRLTVRKCFVAECPQVCLAAAPRRHCTHSNIESCVEHQLPNQLFERNQPCLLPPRSKVGKRIPAFLAKNPIRTILCIAQHCVVIRTPLRARRTDACKLIDREVPDFRTHHGNQRNVLLFVVDDFEQGQEHIDFHRVKIAVIVIDIGRQIVVAQSLVKNIPVVFDSTQQDNNVTFLQRSFDAALAVKNRLSQ